MKNIILVRDLQFSYEKNSQPIISISNWQVNESESVFLYGPSGTGKSTFLNLLTGLLLPQSGEVQILGQAINRLSAGRRDQFRAQHLGYVFQQFNLIPYLSVLDNVKMSSYFAKITSAENTAVSEELLLSLNIDKTHWHKPARDLSIGQQQRVAIARALAHQPQILIADEPTSALDTANRDGFINILLEQVEQRNMSLVFVSHDLGLAPSFKRSDSLSSINSAKMLNAQNS